MLLLSRVMTVIHPLILRTVITNITCVDEDGEADCPPTEDTDLWIIFYAATKLAAEVINYTREIPFSYVSANAEKYIAKTVHSHMQNQSLSFHLGRETGKVLRMVNKGSQSFASVMRYSMFTMLPTFLEVAFTIGVIGYLYDQKFFWLNFGTILVYLIATLICTEWRAKYFKKMSEQDAKYVQKATDSLLNFETVKYFNAEDHERGRFYKSLLAYK
jgi:ATP-binding cassette subfamily B protein